jgi:mono/diheme cytochrome c family protein
MRILCTAASLCLVAFLFPSPCNIWGQSKDAPSPIPLTESEVRGEGVFFQRCSVCHLPKRPTAKASQTAPSPGPSLKGILKVGSGGKEVVIREIIKQGTAGMPGFQYGLSPEEMNELIAYLKVQ